MNFIELLSLCFLAALTCVASLEKSTIIEGKLLYPLLTPNANDFVPFNETTKITLNHGIDYVTYSRSDGSFTIRNVRPGVHVIDVHSVTYHFPQIKCQYKVESIDGASSLSCLEYAYPGANKQPTGTPLQIVAAATYDYFEVRQGFSVFGILRNPMFLMMGFSAVMMFLMPKLMEGMDEEDKQRMKQQMEMQKDPTKMLGQLWGDLTGAGEDPASSIKAKKKA
jgi:ER membrane protein complex subunit 7